MKLHFDMSQSVNKHRCPAGAAKRLALLAVLFSSSASAVDGFGLEYGEEQGSGSVELARVALQWQWDDLWLAHGNWYLGGYWDLTLAYWRNDDPARTSSGIWDIGLTPVFRWQQKERGSLSPYIETGLGDHLLSETSVAPNQRFSTNFQFGSHLGVGVRFGQDHALDLSARINHLSNADIRTPNDGINFYEVRLGYWF
jgi:lipid A 3-O-deacylase